MPQCAKEMSFNDFAQIVGNHIYVFSPAVFDINGGRKSSSFTEIQLLCLDFDNNTEGKTISIDEVLARAKKNDLPIAFAYETPGSINRSKFRIVFRFCEPIYNIDFYNIMYAVLLEFFPEADFSAKDISRMFCGGKGLITDINYETLNPRRLFSSLYMLYDNDSKTVVKKVNDFADRYGIETVKNTFKIGMIDNNTLIKNIEINIPILFNCMGEDETFVIYKKINKKVLKKAGNELNAKPIRNVDENMLFEKCILLRDFACGKRWLYYNEIWGMLTNISHISGGFKLFKAIIDYLKEKDFYPYNYEKWYSNIKQLKKCLIGLSRCADYCPYCDECCHSANIVTTVKPLRQGITIKYNHSKYVSLEEARIDLNYKIQSAINSPYNKLHVIIAQTGLGKTDGYIKAIKESEKSFIIAAPTNDLKNEIHIRLKVAGIDSVVTPELPADLTEDEKKELEKKYNKGDLKGYSSLIKKLKRKYKSMQEFSEDLNNSRIYKGNIVTTHARLLYIFDDETLSSHEIIIDEDILDTLYNNSKISRKDIEYLLKCSYLGKEAKERIKYYSKAKNGSCGKYKKHLREPNITLTENEKASLAEDDEITFDLEQFLNADATMADENFVYYAWTRKLPAKKMLLFSATVNTEVYDKFFKTKNISAEYYRVKEAKYKGRIIQNTSFAYSRNWMSKHTEEAQKIREKHRNCTEITFKAFSSPESNLYFGNTEGKDRYSENNFLILGTPFHNEIVYELLAVCMDYDINSINAAEINHCVTDYDRYSFYFFTYADEFMRNIETYYVSSELEQSAGRARLLSKENTVYVYSCFPLKQAEFV